MQGDDFEVNRTHKYNSWSRQRQQFIVRCSVAEGDQGASSWQRECGQKQYDQTFVQVGAASLLCPVPRLFS